MARIVLKEYLFRRIEADDQVDTAGTGAAVQ